jgi:integrating conjugative element membrane protein (TIGR03747 family)
MKKQPEKQVQTTLFGKIFWMIMRVITWAMLGWLLVIIISCIMVLWLGHESGLNYLNDLLNGQLYYLDTISHEFSINWPINFAVTCAHFVYEWMFVKTNLIHFIQDAQQSIQRSDSINNFANIYLKSNSVISSTYSIVATYLKAVVISTELMVIKLITLFLSLFGIALIMLVGIADGLVQRDIRKFSGARETALLYHRAKSIALSFIIIGIFVYLILPLNFAPEFILIPTAAISAYFIMLSIKLFKKNA